MCSAVASNKSLLSVVSFVKAGKLNALKSYNERNILPMMVPMNIKQFID